MKCLQGNKTQYECTYSLTFGTQLMKFLDNLRCKKTIEKMGLSYPMINMEV